MTTAFTSKLAAIALTLIASTTLLIGAVGPATPLAADTAAARLA